MGEFRTVEQIRALPDLRPLEEELLEKTETGEGLTLGDGKLPSEGNESRSIRAGIIRYLLLGGCEGLRCHEKGIQIRGAWVPDLLDLTGCDSDNALDIENSRFSVKPMLRGARLRAVFLDGCHCPGIDADRLRLRESMHLGGGFHATGEVRLLGAEVGGDLDCSDGTFSNKGGTTLFADGLTTGDNVNMTGNFCSTGEVRLRGAKIGGSLDCTGGTFVNESGDALNADSLKTGGYVLLRNKFQAHGTVWLLGAEIGGDLDCNGGKFCKQDGEALYAYKVHISGSLFWREGASAIGQIDFSDGSCGQINDYWRDWPEVTGSLSLNGFTYGSIGGQGTVDAETRLKWLALDDASDGFRPQPYQHLAKVLLEMGHTEDARKVMVEKERLQRADRLARLKERLASMEPTARASEDQHSAQTTRVDHHQLKFDLWWSPKWNWLFRRLVGYGYYPFNSFWAGLGLFLVAAALFSATWNTGAFAPNSPVILISEEWASVLSEDNPAKAWEDGPGRDYETYHTLAYAFDTVIPLIDLGQESAWAPSTSRGPVGWVAWWAKWFLKVAGWIITALGAAALTGIIRRD